MQSANTRKVLAAVSYVVHGNLLSSLVTATVDNMNDAAYQPIGITSSLMMSL